MAWLNREQPNDSFLRRIKSPKDQLIVQVKQELEYKACELQLIVEQIWREKFAKYMLPNISCVKTILAGTKNELILSYCAVAENPREFGQQISTFEIRSTIYYDEDLEQYLFKYKIILLDVDGSNSFDSNSVIVDEDSQEKFAEKVAEFLDSWITQSRVRVTEEKITTELFSEKSKPKLGRWTPRNLWR